MRAVGIHVFAGGFTAGVQQSEHWEVDTQLETHNFGLGTATKMCGVNCVNDEDAEWPHVEARMAYGNPRCTGFSTITSGYDSSTHGPWAKQTCDIHQMCKYAAGRYDFVVWESVQQAFSVGRPLLDYLRDEYFAPKNYRIAHLMLNATTFGNAQQRKRYFFVAYRDCFKFNIEAPPDLGPFYPVLHDAIYDLRDLPTEEGELHIREADYHPDTYVRLTPDEKYVVQRLPNGWDTNTLGRYDRESLPEIYKFKWDYRTSELPFSLHSVVRLNWLRPSPTLHSSCQRFIHPWHHRPITVREMSTIMGWPDTPVGPNPAAQIAKGIVPAVGTWLADQVALSINGAWGTDDWESTFDAKAGGWVGDDATGKVEKIFDLTSYYGKHFDVERYPTDCLARSHRLDMERKRRER